MFIIITSTIVILAIHLGIPPPSRMVNLSLLDAHGPLCPLEDGPCSLSCPLPSSPCPHLLSLGDHGQSRLPHPRDQMADLMTWHVQARSKAQNTANKLLVTRRSVTLPRLSFQGLVHATYQQTQPLLQTASPPPGSHCW